MIVDTSAVISMLARESDAERFLKAAAEAATCRMSVANYVEASMVSERIGGSEGVAALRRLLSSLGIVLVPVTAEQSELAIQGWRRFGKGRHAAGLNYGDCFAYALAFSANEPLLFKGDAFSQTDIRSV